MFKVLALLVAGQLAVDAGKPERTVIEVDRGTLSSTDGGVFLVSGGCYLDTHACLTTGQELANYRATGQSLKDQAKPSWVAFGAGTAIGIAIGVLVTAAIVAYLPQPQK